MEKYRPTLLLDEADTVLPRNDELCGLFNSGHTRSAAVVIRTVGDEYEPRAFSTWCAKMIASIGALPETITDRSIVISMKRRAPGEKVERLRLDRLGRIVRHRRRIALTRLRC